jgi:hypothetical protein
MAITDCQKCWETPCECGFEYEHWTTERISKLIGVLTRVLAERRDGKPVRRYSWEAASDESTSTERSEDGRGQGR